MIRFTPIPSLLGGLLIGAATSALWLLSGRLAGISGVAAGVVAPRPGETLWRVLFLAGLVVGGVLYAQMAPDAFAFTLNRSDRTLIAAGLLVGIGTRLGGGCTSGHGICGIGRFSLRSIVATMVFMLVAAGAVYVVEHVW